MLYINGLVIVVQSKKVSSLTDSVATETLGPYLTFKILNENSNLNFQTRKVGNSATVNLRNTNLNIISILNNTNLDNNNIRSGKKYTP